MRASEVSNWNRKLKLAKLVLRCRLVSQTRVLPNTTTPHFSLDGFFFLKEEHFSQHFFLKGYAVLGLQCLALCFLRFYFFPVSICEIRLGYPPEDTILRKGRPSRVSRFSRKLLNDAHSVLYKQT